MILENLANSQLIENLGWTLLHSIWQLAFIGFWLYLALRAAAKSSANSRYLTSLFALVLALILPVTTFIFLSQKTSSVTQTSVNSKLENALIDIEKIQPPENLSALKNTAAVDFIEEDFFTSVNGWQNGLAENFSAAAPVLVGLWFLGMLFSAVRLFGGVWQLTFIKLAARLRRTMIGRRDSPRSANV
jgi:hypothetical protein